MSYIHLLTCSPRRSSTIASQRKHPVTLSSVLFGPAQPNVFEQLVKQGKHSTFKNNRV